MIYRAKTTVGEIALPHDPAYLARIEDILHHPSVAQMKQYIQHGTTTCLEHSVNVSYFSYLFCAQHGLNASEAARGGLLHDLFLYDWHLRPRQKGELLHGFEHPRKALKNASDLFELSDREKNIIQRHMWPLTLTPPRYKEAYVVVWFDKYCSLMETLHLPVMQLFEYAQLEYAPRKVREALRGQPFPSPVQQQA